MYERVGDGMCARRKKVARREEEQRNTFACSASRSAALDLAGVPAKLEHRGPRKKVSTGTRCRLGMEWGIMRAHAREYRAALRGDSNSGDSMCGMPASGLNRE